MSGKFGLHPKSIQRQHLCKNEEHLLPEMSYATFLFVFKHKITNYQMLYEKKKKKKPTTMDNGTCSNS